MAGSNTGHLGREIGRPARAVKRLATGLNVAAGWGVLGMTALTCADVILRLFRHPILGTYDLVCFIGALVAALAMADTTIRGGHIAVEILVSRLNARTQAVIYTITHLASIALFAVLAYQSLLLGNSLRASGEVSMTIRIPFYPVLYAISFSCWVVCLVLLVELMQVVTGKARAWYSWEA